jgi:hypothetical protein
MQSNTKQTSADKCSNPWHAGESLGSQFFPACPSCGRGPEVWAITRDDRGESYPVAVFVGNERDAERCAQRLQASVSGTVEVYGPESSSQESKS